MDWKASPSLMTQGHHYGCYWYLMANAYTQEPAGCTQQVCSAGPPYPLLSAPSTFPLLCGPQWLLTAHSSFTTSSHSSVFWVEWKWETHGRKCWEINAKAQYSWGNQRILLTSSPSAEFQSEFKQTRAFLQAPPGPETISKSGLRQRPNEAFLRVRRGPFLRVPGIIHNPPDHSSPLRGRDWANPPLLSEVTPLTHQQAGRDLISQGEGPWRPGEAASVSLAQAEASGSSSPPWGPWAGRDLSSPPAVPEKVHTGARRAGNSLFVLF